jgi:hypothetical protein
MGRVFRRPPPVDDLHATSLPPYSEETTVLAVEGHEGNVGEAGLQSKYGPQGSLRPIVIRGSRLPGPRRRTGHQPDRAADETPTRKLSPGKTCLHHHRLVATSDGRIVSLARIPIPGATTSATPLAVEPVSIPIGDGSLHSHPQPHRLIAPTNAHRRRLYHGCGHRYTRYLHSTPSGLQQMPDLLRRRFRVRN